MSAWRTEAVAPGPAACVPAQVQRCGGVTCPPGTCGHDDELQRHADGPGPGAVPVTVLGVLGTPGTPLDPAVRTSMEGRFGHDFGNVRIHTDADAARSAADIHASAYTFGSHVVMGAGRHQPHTAAGQRLLTHELAHVVQQGSSSGPPTSISDPHDPAELQADAMAPDLATRPSAGSGLVARQVTPEPTSDAGTSTTADAGTSTAGDAGTLTIADAGTPATGAAAIDAGSPAPPGSAPSAGPTGRRTGRPIADLERDFRSMAGTARTRGYPVAADNLVHFLDGGGATRSVPLSWLRSFGAFTDGERRNQARFEDQLSSRAPGTPAGGTQNHSDHWDAKIDASKLTELFYASGISQLRSTGTFTLARVSTTVSIAGSVDQRWFDTYNWNPGMGAYIPGYGRVSDDVGLDLKDAGRGHDYLLENRYQQVLAGTYTIQPWYRPDTKTYSWSGP